MRYFKKTLLWIILLAILGGYLYIYEIRGGREREEVAEEARRLFHFTPDDIVELELKKPESHIHLVRSDKGWMMTLPVNARADDKEVQKVLQYITETRNDSDYVMDENPSPKRLVEFGLANPKLEVNIKVNGDPDTKVIYFGERGPTQNIAYAIVKGDPRVYRVVADARAEADKDAYYFRDKRIVNFKPYEIEKIGVATEGQVIRAELPMQGKWEITRPIKGRADVVTIMELLSKISEGEIKAFIDENPKSLKVYGLKPPKVELNFWMGGEGKAGTTLFLGDKDIKKRGVYAKRKDAPNVFLLEEDMWDIVPRDVSHLRDRLVFFFDEEKIEKIALKSPGKEIVWEKTPKLEWRQKVPANSSVEFSIIKNIIDRLKGLRVQEFVLDNPRELKEFGLDNPQYNIRVWEKGIGKPQELFIGKTDHSSSAVYALMGQSDSLILVGPEVKEIFTGPQHSSF